MDDTELGRNSCFFTTVVTVLIVGVAAGTWLLASWRSQRTARAALQRRGAGVDPPTGAVLERMLTARTRAAAVGTAVGAVLVCAATWVFVPGNDKVSTDAAFTLTAVLLAAVAVGGVAECLVVVRTAAVVGEGPRVAGLTPREPTAEAGRGEHWAELCLVVLVSGALLASATAWVVEGTGFGLPGATICAAAGLAVIVGALATRLWLVRRPMPAASPEGVTVQEVVMMSSAERLADNARSVGGLCGVYAFVLLGQATALPLAVVGAVSCAALMIIAAVARQRRGRATARPAISGRRR